MNNGVKNKSKPIGKETFSKLCVVPCEFGFIAYNYMLISKPLREARKNSSLLSYLQLKCTKVGDFPLPLPFEKSCRQITFLSVTFFNFLTDLKLE